jgi:shikimate dehydrogenase
VLDCLDELSEDAAAIGAVNTIVFAEGRRLGFNTDCSGFQESFRRGLPEASLGEVMQFGAGGAGMAVARALLQLGAGRLWICDLDLGKAEALCGSLRRQFGPERAAAVAAAEETARRADGLVNATPLGMDKYPGSPVSPEWLSARQWVADIVYFPEETALVREAEQRGCATLRGGGMAVSQAAKAFELFTGRRPDPEQMRHHYARAGSVD